MEQHKIVITLIKTPGATPENQLRVEGKGVHPREIMAACYSIIKRLEAILESDPAQEVNSDINEESDASVTSGQDGEVEVEFKNITKHYNFD